MFVSATHLRGFVSIIFLGRVAVYIHFFFLSIQCVPFAIKKKYLLVKFDFFLFNHDEAMYDGKSQCFYTDQPARHEFLISFWSVSWFHSTW